MQIPLKEQFVLQLQKPMQNANKNKTALIYSTLTQQLNN